MVHDYIRQNVFGAILNKLIPDLKSVDVTTDGEKVGQAQPFNITVANPAAVAVINEMMTEIVAGKKQA
jgi:hypothetical protein